MAARRFGGPAVSPETALMWLLFGFFALCLLLAAFLVLWFIVDTLRGKS